MKKRTLKATLIVFVISISSIALASFVIQDAQAVLGDYDDVTLYPEMWIKFLGNFTTYESSVAGKLIADGKTPLSANKADGSWTFSFGVGLKPMDLSTLSINDVSNLAVDPRDDQFGGEEINLGASSFLGNPSYLIDNATDVDANDNEYFFWEDQTFDSNTYPYLLIEDASTPSTTYGSIIAGGATSGNITIFNGLMVGTGCDDVWFRLDKHCDNENIDNLTISEISYSSIQVFSFSSDRIWADSRYMDVYVGDTETDATVTAAAFDDGTDFPLVRLYESSWHLDNGPVLTPNNWYDITTTADILACRSPYWEETGYLRVSGWLDDNDLEEDLLNAIAAAEGFSDSSAIRDYACANAITLWKQDNSDVMEAISKEVTDAISQTSDVQTFVNLVAKNTMPLNAFLVGVDDDILGSLMALNGLPSDSEIDGLTANNLWDDIKAGANKIFDTVSAGVASIGKGASRVATWGMDMISGTQKTVTSTISGAITGIVDTTGKIANNVVGAVTTKGGALNPLGFLNKITWWVWLIIAGAVILVIVVVWGLVRLANSRTASSAAEAAAKRYL